MAAASSNSNSNISASEDENDDDKYYTVECVLGKRIRKGVLYYLVKWEGFDDDKNTWEPMENLEDAMASILEYEEEQSVKSCTSEEIEIVGLEPLKNGGGITVFVKTKVADRVFKFNSKEVAEQWPMLYVDYLQQHIKFQKRNGVPRWAGPSTNKHKNQKSDE